MKKTDKTDKTAKELEDFSHDIVDSCLFDGVSPLEPFKTPSLENSLFKDDQNFGLDFDNKDIFG